ncbi:FAD-dependent oxidoreductase [Rhodoferax sp.]|uniref:FAD-dependent oxidoreductase n=1 Tax=Rhodoferax sp. TaxID=50421 RepID=UPI0027575D3F|nr:FAD-dependent oxidoreductase [Rhodoferax sp.]
MKKLVLVGGGHAQLSVLQALATARVQGVETTLITPSAHQNYSGMLPGWMAGHYSQAQCRIDLRPLAQAAGVKLVLDHVTGLDATQRRVHLADGQSVDYDVLSLDIGSETASSGLNALGDKLLPIKPLDNFFAAWPAVLAEARTQQGFRLVVVGAGAGGVEVALAARHAFSQAALDAQVALVAADTGLLPGHGAGVQRRVRQLAKRFGLVLHFAQALATARGLTLSDGQVLAADCVIAATGARAAPWLVGTGLALDDAGYVLVNAHHRSLSHADVFAAGDTCARQDVAMARSGVHAVFAGPVLAHNLLATLSGGALRAYRPKPRPLYLLACGPRYAVASWGGWSAQGAWVWYWKDWIDRGFIRRFSG